MDVYQRKKKCQDELFKIISMCDEIEISKLYFYAGTIYAFPKKFVDKYLELIKDGEYIEIRGNIVINLKKKIPDPENKKEESN
jgi:hypothetical protein